MKKFSLILTVVCFFLIGSSFQRIAGQEKTKKEQENEIKVLQAIEEQKKNMTEQKKDEMEQQEKKAQKESQDEFDAQENAMENLKDKHLELEDALKDLQFDIEVNDEGEADNSVRIYRRRGNRTFDFRVPYTASPDVDVFSDFNFGEDRERTSWTYSKFVKESSFSNSYSFDVEESANTVIMSVVGDCKEGEIRIKIVMPGGKNYSEVVIDESGNLNWRKSISISDTENQDKTGEWKFKIESSDATGYFKISLQTY